MKSGRLGCPAERALLGESGLDIGHPVGQGLLSTLPLGLGLNELSCQEKWSMWDGGDICSMGLVM